MLRRFLRFGRRFVVDDLDFGLEFVTRGLVFTLRRLDGHNALVTGHSGAQLVFEVLVVLVRHLIVCVHRRRPVQSDGCLPVRCDSLAIAGHARDQTFVISSGPVRIASPTESTGSAWGYQNESERMARRKWDKLRAAKIVMEFTVEAKFRTCRQRLG